MGSKNGTNPTKLPATQADVNRAERRGQKKGQAEGARFMAGVFIMTLRDKKSDVFTDRDLEETFAAVRKLMEEVTEGRVKGSDILKTLEEEGMKVLMK